MQFHHFTVTNQGNDTVNRKTFSFDLNADKVHFWRRLFHVLAERDWKCSVTNGNDWCQWYRKCEVNDECKPQWPADQWRQWWVQASLSSSSWQAASASPWTHRYTSMASLHDICSVNYVKLGRKKEKNRCKPQKKEIMPQSASYRYLCCVITFILVIFSINCQHWTECSVIQQVMTALSFHSQTLHACHRRDITMVSCTCSLQHYQIT